MAGIAMSNRASASPTHDAIQIRMREEGESSMFAVIMAGGKGARFWPRSREKMPKHLLDILGERTIIQETAARLRPLVPPERTLIVTGSSHAAELARQLPEIPGENILIEPVGRNTAPCIGWAALHIQERAGDAVMACLPADHRIADETVFLRVLDAAARAAAHGALVTVGIQPTGPETGYGYIEQGSPLPAEGQDPVYKVRSFREKPERATAEQFLRQGGFVWNSGIFVWRASTILSEIECRLPALHQGLLKIRAAMGTDREEEIVASVYEGLQGVSIDYGVMEKAQEVLVILGGFGWSDLGSWDALWEILPKDAEGNAVRGEWVGIDARRSLIHSPGKLVALVGVEDLLVVDTPDALLICRRGRSQGIRQVVETLEKRRLDDYL
ncbi:MAG: mannose-1-phosphate guanylyltransferase [Syntrophaceae bacterium]|nr:mannose-1-phosphate guanylyltransferase [Syntrophaceae bacterium]